MKVPPKRKGNLETKGRKEHENLSLNESPSEKEGKSGTFAASIVMTTRLNESPSEKEGKCWFLHSVLWCPNGPQ